MEIFYNIEEIDICEKAKRLISKYFEYKTSLINDENENVSVIYLRFSKIISRNFIKSFPKLKFIICNATGISHIDTDFCRSLGIEVYSLKNERDFLEKKISSSAELSWLLLLAAARELKLVFQKVNQGDFNRNSFNGIQIIDKNILIIGLGRNGKKIATFAKSFGMNIFYFDPNVKCKLYTRCIDIASKFHEMDFVILSLPYNEETKLLINQQILQKGSGKTILINTSRGEIVDEEAILRALNAKKLKTYATDVISDELNYKKNIIYLNRYRDDIILTPHVGGVTKDAWELTEVYLIEKLLESKNRKRN